MHEMSENDFRDLTLINGIKGKDGLVDKTINTKRKSFLNNDVYS